MTIFMLAAWEFIKKYWKYVVVVVLIIAAAILGARCGDMSPKFSDLRNVYETEVQKIDAARLSERARLEENDRKYKEALAVIQKQYDADKKKLDEKKKEEIKTIIDDYGDDPEMLAEVLAEATGFTVIMPE